ncbi:LysR family transcriptional regulator [Pseudonocardia humida]|uniref:LysR family transcriptional regulator n=1 Tax=Pseudonocardia humida TaxID=2800819 RepID=A0ABT1ADV9_9PSEU|nr:LysR family transcriptional regulator [Pseudonocardia humida]MCO1661115.1 LysR family transcriptional regulator [Pseudonocardia humida]
MGLDLFKLRVFVTVVDRNGYSAAAGHLGLSQGTVSFHVHGLERHLGVSLVRYERRAVRLTPAGEHVYRWAQRLLRDEQHLVRSVRGGHRGRATLGASIAFEQAYFFDKIVAPYRRAHPDVLLSVHFGHSVGMAEAVADHRVDLAYVIGWQVPAGLHYEPLHPARFTLFVARDHLLAGEETVSAAQVADAGLIAAPLDDVERVHYERVLDGLDLGPRDVTLEIDGIQARVLAAAAGLGVLGTFHPAYAGTSTPSGLTPLRLDRPLPSVEVGLLSRRADIPAGGAEALADCIRTTTAETG